MAKKFFYNRVYNTKRTIINIIIIGVCIIGVILCFIITSNFQGESHKTPESSLSIKNDVTIEINEEITKDMFFSKVENVNLDDIEIQYPDTFNLSVVGKYEVILKIDNKDYKTNLIVVDTTKPTLALKTVTITKGKNYTVNDFITSCSDNSNKKCNISFYTEGIDEDGKSIDYSKFTEAGTYSIKISAKDESGNQIVKETQLVIRKNSQENNNKPVTTNCKYGNNVYDKSKYLVAVDISSKGCAVSLDLYNDATMTEEINKLMETESTRIKKDINKLNLSGKLTLNRKVTAVINTIGDGIVGYELRITVLVTNNNKNNTVVDYKVDQDGKRVFITNPYSISK